MIRICHRSARSVSVCGEYTPPFLTQRTIDPPVTKSFSTFFIMANKKPCYCPNCNGAMRAATTVKKHAERAAEAEAANIARQEAWEHAKQYVAAEDDIFEEYNKSVFNGSYGDEEAGERPNKRCRREIGRASCRERV